jgi:hypothetical protein
MIRSSFLAGAIGLLVSACATPEASTPDMARDDSRVPSVAEIREPIAAVLSDETVARRLNAVLADALEQSAIPLAAEVTVLPTPGPGQVAQPFSTPIILYAASNFLCATANPVWESNPFPWFSARYCAGPRARTIYADYFLLDGNGDETHTPTTIDCAIRNLVFPPIPSGAQTAICR